MVATVVEPPERSRLEAGANGGFAVIHSETLREALRTVRERPVNAVLVSPRCVSPDQLSNLTTLVRGFPGVPTVAVLSRHDAASSERLLHLGACGVARVLDLGVRDGWQRLRDLVAQPTAPTASLILARVMPALGDASLSCRRYFEVLVQRAPGVTTVRALARQLGMGTSTFMSRFFRAGLPSPKRYLAAVRLVYAAGLLESPGLSIADVAYRLEYSSPQSFSRHLRTALGLTAGEFRKRYAFHAALDDFIARLIVPYRRHLRTFHPLPTGVSDYGQDW
jgi:AraC-like DNA-binding protein